MLLFERLSPAVLKGRCCLPHALQLLDTKNATPPENTGYLFVNFKRDNLAGVQSCLV